MVLRYEGSMKIRPLKNKNPPSATVRAKTLARSSIKARLNGLVLGSVALSTVPVFGLLSYQEAVRTAENRWAVMKTAADVLASSSLEAAQNRDAERAFGAIRAVSRTPGISYARIRLASGEILAENGAGARLRSNVVVRADANKPDLRALLLTKSIQVEAPIIANNKEIGKVIVTHQFSGLFGQIIDALSGMVVLSLLALAGSLMVSLRLQRKLISPLVGLRDFVISTRKKLESHDRYQMRAPREANDEVGDLAEGINALLEAISERDVLIEAQVDGLEREVSLRTDQYRLARDEADYATKAKSQFLATMSHEIRTPMNGVLVMGELLSKESLSARARRLTETLIKSGQSLLMVINDILDFSKIEAGKMELEIREIDVMSTLEPVMELFYAKALEKNLGFELIIDPDAPKILRADSVRVSQIVSNLISNALKFTQKGHVLVQLLRDKSDGYVRIIVSDTGLGLSLEQQKKLFTAFGQADISTTRKHGGTGLGLSIVKSLTEAMGGDVGVKSSLGQGSHFLVRLKSVNEAESCALPALNNHPRLQIITQSDARLNNLTTLFTHAGAVIVRELPDWLLIDRVLWENLDESKTARPIFSRIILMSGIEDDHAQKIIDEQGAGAVMRLPLRHSDLVCLAQAINLDQIPDFDHGSDKDKLEISYRHAKILVVDDVLVNIEIAKEALSQFGISPFEAHNGQEALEFLAKNNLDLVLMDGSMPVMDGFEATRRWRATEAMGETAQAALPIIAMTAHVVGEAAFSWREAGMNDVLTKPFRLDDLGAILEKYLDPALRESKMIKAHPLVKSEEESAKKSDDSLCVFWDEKIAGELFSKLKGPQKDFALRVFNLYVSHAPEAFAQAQKAFSDHDLNALAKAVHALKGMSYNIGARGVAEQANAIEKAIRVDPRPIKSDDLLALEQVIKTTLGDIEARITQKDGLIASPTPHITLKDTLVDEERLMFIELKAAIKDGAFDIAYQPIFDRLGEKIVSAEALIRWPRTDKPNISPAVFIPLAERNGLIGALGALVREKVFKQAVKWQTVPIAINMSPLELNESDFISNISDLVKKRDIDPALIVFELTETAFVDDPIHTLDMMRKLKSLGFKLALDDFGAGYSSLTALHRFPFDKVKIDKAFVSALDEAPKEALEALAIIQAVSGLGRAFGLQVVAEGVETVNQHHHLKAAGIHALQGYLFSKPLTGDDFIRLVTKIKTEPKPSVQMR